MMISSFKRGFIYHTFIKCYLCGDAALDTREFVMNGTYQIPALTEAFTHSWRRRTLKPDSAAGLKCSAKGSSGF